MKPNMHLKREREHRGWSQARLAQELGLDTQTISRWERGVVRPYPYHRELLCRLFNTNAASLGLVLEQDEAQREKPELEPSSVVEALTHTPIFFLDPTVPLTPVQSSELIGRTELLNTLKERLIREKPAPLTLLQGLPGAGKTAIATAIARDPEIQKHFPDGILWAGIGPTPDLTSHLGRWNALLDLSSLFKEGQNSLSAQADSLHTIIGQRRILFIIDDVWNIEQYLALKVGGSNCAYLITTRAPQISMKFARQEKLVVPELTPQQGLALLAVFIPDVIADDSEHSRKLVEMVGGLPLALTLMGSYLRAYATTGQPRRLRSAIQQLYDTHYRLHLSEPIAPIERAPAFKDQNTISLASVIALSLQRIDEQARQVLYALALFPPKPASFSETAALSVSHAPVEMLDLLCDAGLLETPEPGRYQLHQTICDYACLQANNDEALKRLVEYTVQFVQRTCLGYYQMHSIGYTVLEQECPNIVATLELAHQHGLQRGYIEIITAFSIFLEIRGQYTLAITHLQKAYQLARSQEDLSLLVPVLARLGLIARQQHRIAQAETHLREGLNYARQLGDRKTASAIMINLAELLEQRGEYQQAYAYLSEGQGLSNYLGYGERTFYHRMMTIQEAVSMGVYFTEPQDMLRRGYLTDITELFQAWQDMDSFNPGVLSIFTGADRRLYGIPCTVYGLCLIYNRRLFREAGLDPDRPPQTWQEFREVARLVSNPRKEIYGFAESSVYNMGGWSFTNWLYSAGAEVLRYEDQRWQVAFNTPRAVQILLMLKQMRFDDQTMPPHGLLTSGHIFERFQQQKLAMMISDSSDASHLPLAGTIKLADIGIAPMPQNGGNAALMGGSGYVFKAGSASDRLHMAFYKVVQTHFNFDRYEESLRALVASGRAVGVPGISLFAGSLRQHLAATTARYTNAPLENYVHYLNSSIEFKPEPQVEAQHYYRLLDPVIQAVLTDPKAEPEQLLNSAARQFTEHYLLHMTAELAERPGKIPP